MYFAKELFHLPTDARIIAAFTDGTEAEHTTCIVHLLVSDPSVKHIIDSETGEILFHR